MFDRLESGLEMRREGKASIPHADKYDPSKASEKSFAAMIARRRLIDGLRRVTRRPEVQMFEDASDPSGRQHIDMELSVEAQSAAKLLDGLRPE